MRFFTVLIAIFMVVITPVFAFAGGNTSAYTKLNFDKNCKVFDEYELGVSAKCTGYKDYPVYFHEGDLRQMVRFGYTTPKSERWESFGEFNTAGSTVEWRIADKPIATVLRWYIDNYNPDTGEHDKAHRGQVLVISTIASKGNPHNACVVGYVDARANKNANVLARKVADTIAPNFTCGTDMPKFHGVKGPLAGSPTYFAE